MMAFKCKMCGGDLSFEQGASVCECPYCMTTQTLPKLDDDKRANMYDRANHFRRQNEYDKAAAIFEQILQEDQTDAEAYWSLVLCKYGIEYVEDPASHKRIPTVNRVQYASILADEDYKSALQNADSVQRSIYEREAKTIAEIQRGILEISKKEQPFDVFICYKETDESGRRTHDSVLANDMYHQLTKEGFKVFFSRITLEDKIGSAYEPYIFAALNSARVMVVVGTKPEYFQAVWVKNEWSRYLALIKAGAEKTLVPAYRDMDPYDLPDEFAHLQAQDMGKLGFMQDLIEEIRRNTDTDMLEKQPIIEKPATANGISIENLMKRVRLFLEDGDFESAKKYLDRILDINAEYAPAYFGKVQAAMKLQNEEEFGSCLLRFEDTPDWQKAVRFSKSQEKEEYMRYASAARRNREKQLCYLMEKARVYLADGDFVNAQECFNNVLCFEDEYAPAYVGKVQTAFKLRNEEELGSCLFKYEDTPDWHKAIQYAEPGQRERYKRFVQDAKDKREERLKEMINERPTLATGRYNTVGIRTNGTVAVVGEIYYSRVSVGIDAWTDIVAVGIGYKFLLGLKMDGKVVTVGLRSNIEEWKGITAIATGLNHAVGLKSDGTVVAVGSNSEGQCNITDWTDIVSIVACADQTMGLKFDGTAVAVGDNSSGQCDVGNWRDIKAIIPCGRHTIGLKSDGTVVAVGDNEYGQCSIDKWTDIVAITTDWNHTVGLKANGSVVAVGSNEKGQCEVDKWKDIVAVTACGTYTIGLKASGTVVVAGTSSFGLRDLDKWTDIVAIAADSSHAVGLRSDGTVISVGDNSFGQCEVDDWKNIKLPTRTIHKLL